MSEVVNVIVAFAVIVLLFRWVTSGKSAPNQPSPADILGFRPKNVTQQMVDQVHSMFPDIPPDNIRYDLLRTGSVEWTTNKILERGMLEAPPDRYFTLYPRTQPTTPAPSTPAPAAPKPAPKQQNLISRYNLRDRIKDDSSVIIDDALNSKAVWEDTPDKREASLRERKAKMILAARQRLMAQPHQVSGPSS